MANEFEPTWRNILNLENVHWIEDHRIHTYIVFPGAGYIATIGEAIPQLTGSEAYTVGDITISAAMVLPKSRELEMMTSLNSSRVTVSLDSVWYDFMISSYNGTLWMKHCIGQTRSGSETEMPKPDEINDLPRHVPSQRWYQTMAKICLNYGQAFNGLMEISAGVNEHVATASVLNEFKQGESRYALYPTTLDLCFQLMIVALLKGQSRVFDRLCIPTYIKELYVRNSPSKIRLHAHTTPKQGTITGDACGTVDGKPVLLLKGLRLSPVEQDTVGDGDPHAAVELEWKPDIDFLKDKNLIKVFKNVRTDHMLNEELAMLYILETISRLAKIKEQRLQVNNNKYTLPIDAGELAKLNQSDRIKLIHNIYNQTQTSDDADVGKVLFRVLENVESIIEGKVDVLEYYKEFFSVLTHSKPHLKILEIGAGTGAKTATILKNIELEYGERLYEKYTFTDISVGFFVAVKQRFQDFAGIGIDYAVLDISKDPIEQGLEPNSYYFILASNVIRATPSINESLSNIHKLLHPNGRLLLQELCPKTKWVNDIMGMFSGWWLGEDDNRLGELFITPERWGEELRKTGFSGAKTVLYYDDPPYQINANILARPIISITPTKKVTLVYAKEITPELRKAESALVLSGYEVDICMFPEAPAPDQDVISLMDLEGPFFTNISAEKLAQILKYMILFQAGKVGILWAT
ncbi:S-adenosyl-L-methionine-dependent methyltransferase, partial [Lepidopterella palustris CBS 459.81]